MYVDKTFKAHIDRIYKENPETKFNILVNILDLKDISRSLPHEAMRLYDSIIKSPQTGRMAVVGKDGFSEFVVTVMFFRIKDRRVNWFTERQKALKWLGEG